MTGVCDEDGSLGVRLEHSGGKIGDYLIQGEAHRFIIASGGLAAVGLYLRLGLGGSVRQGRTQTRCLSWRG